MNSELNSTVRSTEKQSLESTHLLIFLKKTEEGTLLHSFTPDIISTKLVVYLLELSALTRTIWNRSGESDDPGMPSPLSQQDSTKHRMDSQQLLQVLCCSQGFI